MFPLHQTPQKLALVSVAVAGPGAFAHPWAGDIYSLMVVLEGGKDPGIPVQALGVCPGVGSAAQDLYCATTQTALQMMASEVQGS